jgi:hypothetical protein
MAGKRDASERQNAPLLFVLKRKRPRKVLTAFECPGKKSLRD